MDCVNTKPLLFAYSSSTHKSPLEPFGTHIAPGFVTRLVSSACLRELPKRHKTVSHRTVLEVCAFRGGFKTSVLSLNRMAPNSKVGLIVEKMIPNKSIACFFEHSESLFACRTMLFTSCSSCRFVYYSTGCSFPGARQALKSTQRFVVVLAATRLSQFMQVPYRFPPRGVPILFWVQFSLARAARE